MQLLHLARLFYEARLSAYEAHFVLASFARQASKYMKHTFRCMKRSLDRLHSPFLPLAKMVGVKLSEPSTSLRYDWS